MIDKKDSPSLELIEFNTISCGLVSLSRAVGDIHTYIMKANPDLFPK